MARFGVKKAITKKRGAKTEVDGDVCSTHGKKRKAEYLIDDGAGGMCCSPDDECKGGKDTSAGKECKWCEQGECWSHGQIEKPERKGRQGKKDVDGDVCSVHGKSRKAEYLVDDGAGGMCCAPGDECKSGKATPAGKPERKRQRKEVGPDGCKWCEQGECWTHGQIEKPERKGRAGRKDVDGDVCSVHGKARKAEYLVDDGEGGMCCSPGDECKAGKDTPAQKPVRNGGKQMKGVGRKGGKGGKGGKGSGGKGGSGMWAWIPM